MMIFRVSRIHDFVEKRVFEIHVFSLLSVRVGSELRHEPLHANARGRFGIPIASLDKRRTDDRHQDDARAERERAAVAAQKVQPAGDRHLEGNHRAGVAHVTYDLGNERGKHHRKRRASPVDSGSVRERGRLEAHLADLKQLEEGSLHIVAFTSTLTQWLPQITKRFTEAHPHIDLRITCYDDQAQLEHIAKSHSHRNRARRRRALRGPSSSARKAGSAKPTKESPRRCCFRGIKKRGRGAIPASFRLRRALLHDPHLEGAHENHGHALAGDGIAGPEVLARRLVVALDKAPRRRPGEGAARPA